MAVLLKSFIVFKHILAQSTLIDGLEPFLILSNDLLALGTALIRVDTHVSTELIGVEKSFITNLTTKLLGLTMLLNRVILEMALVSEAFATGAAFVRLVTSVDPLVMLEPGRVDKGHGASVTAEDCPLGVRLGVPFQVVFVGETPTTDVVSFVGEGTLVLGIGHDLATLVLSLVIAAKLGIPELLLTEPALENLILGMNFPLVSDQGVLRHGLELTVLTRVQVSALGSFVALDVAMNSLSTVTVDAAYQTMGVFFGMIATGMLLQLNQVLKGTVAAFKGTSQVFLMTHSSRSHLLWRGSIGMNSLEMLFSARTGGEGHGAGLTRIKPA